MFTVFYVVIMFVTGQNWDITETGYMGAKKNFAHDKFVITSNEHPLPCHNPLRAPANNEHGNTHLIFQYDNILVPIQGDM
jgi:hypothetical protein